MAKAYITQYARKGRDDRGPTDAGEEPSLGTLVVDFTAGATNSVALNPKTTMLRIYTDTALQFAIGAAPVPDATSTPMPANSVDYFGLPAEVARQGNILVGCRTLA